MVIEAVQSAKEINTEELRLAYKQIYAGVAFPGRRPGFAVVIGMSRDKHFDNHDVHLLDECESADIRDLIRQCGTLDFKYEPAYWFGDSLNDAADQLIREMNEEFKSSRRSFSLNSTQMLDMKQPFLYQYILSKLKNLLHKDHRQLFLKDSKVIDYLGVIDSSEILDIEFGDYPAIEALAFAVIEMRKHGGTGPMTAQESRDIWERHRKP